MHFVQTQARWLRGDSGWHDKGSAGHFRSDVRFDFCFAGGQVKPRRTVHAVGVEQRHGGQFELGADRD